MSVVFVSVLGRVTGLTRIGITTGTRGMTSRRRGIAGVVASWTPSTGRRAAAGVGDVLLLVVFVAGSAGLSWAVRWDAGRAEAKRRRREFRAQLRDVTFRFVADTSAFTAAMDRVVKALAKTTTTPRVAWRDPAPRTAGVTPEWWAVDETQLWDAERLSEALKKTWNTHEPATGVHLWNMPEPELWEGDQA